jgi:ABC-type multidrug transport system ATPase subunit
MSTRDKSNLKENHIVQSNFSVKLQGYRVDRRDGVARKTVIEKMDVALLSGRTVAIMGPSGSGKSTLLKSLLRCDEKLEIHEGKDVVNFHYNGRKMPEKEISSYVAVVPQDDNMHSDLTVQEAIWISAALQNDKGFWGWQSNELRNIVDKALYDLEIAKVRRNRVGSGTDSKKVAISGGQKKRVSIAMELVAERAALWLDEPTSGLDSSNSVKLAETLQKISRQGHSVVAIIHSPSKSTFEYFDDLILFSLSGHIAYAGPREKAALYFKNNGWADSWKNRSEQYASDAEILLEISQGKLFPTNRSQFNELNFAEELNRLWNNEKKDVLSSAGCDTTTHGDLEEEEEDNDDHKGAWFYSWKLHQFMPLLWRTMRVIPIAHGLIFALSFGAVVGVIWYHKSPRERETLAMLCAVLKLNVFSVGVHFIMLLQFGLINVDWESKVMIRELTSVSRLIYFFSKVPAGLFMGFLTQLCYLVGIYMGWTISNEYNNREKVAPLPLRIASCNLRLFGVLLASYWYMHGVVMSLTIWTSSTVGQLVGFASFFAFSMILDSAAVEENFAAVDANNQDFIHSGKCKLSAAWLLRRSLQMLVKGSHTVTSNGIHQRQVKTFFKNECLSGDEIPCVLLLFVHGLFTHLVALILSVLSSCNENDKFNGSLFILFAATIYFFFIIKFWKVVTKVSLIYQI